MSAPQLTVVALGGNALLRKGERGTAAEQRANLADTFAALEPVLRAGPVVITHGNGPQVGNELLRQELGAKEAPQLPLYVAVAQTQAEVGALVASELPQIAERPVAVLVTRVRVAEDDPAFTNPTKPVGPFYDEQQAEQLEKHRGWAMKEDAGRGWRRVVASPEAARDPGAREHPRARRDRRVGRARSAAAASPSSRGKTATTASTP